VGGNICSGRFFYINGDIDYETAFDATNNYSRHFTIVFNTFVMLQVFNFLNARKLQEEVTIALSSSTFSAESLKTTSSQWSFL